jgi:hypothetical protein
MVCSVYCSNWALQCMRQLTCTAVSLLGRLYWIRKSLRGTSAASRRRWRGDVCIRNVVLLQDWLSFSLLTQWNRVLLEKLTGLQLVKKFPAFYGNRMFIAAFKNARHLSLFWASSIHFILTHATSWRSALILYFHLRLGLPIGIFPSGFPTKTLNTPLPCTVHSTCPAHLIILGLIIQTIVGEKYRSLISSLRNFLQSC